MNTRKYLLSAASIVLSLTGCQAAGIASPAPDPTIVAIEAVAEPTATSSPAETEVSDGLTIFYVDPGQTWQAIEDVSGGNFITQFAQTTEPLEDVSRYNLANLPVRTARVRIGLEDWEPVNDDDDPLNFNWDAFHDDGYNHATFELMQHLQAQGSQLIATVWDVPDWLVSNPQKERTRFMPYDLYPEVVESIAAWLITARDSYGVDVDYVSFNEPDIGAYVSLIPAEIVTLLREAGPRFEALDLHTRWLLADVSNLDGSVSFARSIWRAEDVRSYLGPFAVHSWDSDSDDSKFKGVRDFAAEEGLDVWISEAGWGAFLWSTPEVFPTWEYALRLANIYSRLLKMSGASRILYWEMMGDDYPLNDGVQPYPSFEILRQFAEYLPPGTEIVATSDNTESLLWFAARTPHGFLVNLVNPGAEPLAVRIVGVPETALRHLSTSEGETGADLGRVDGSEGHVELILAGGSLNWLIAEK
ncbi:MAG: hypothetical protein U9R25_06465 [Chloroflexota bacterium]|nr:hypothetical protein [Chloroflexota bacterium]